MSKPANTTPDTVLSFDDRLVLVQEEISKRLRKVKPAQQNQYRARLWVRWINANLLNDETAGGAA